VDAEDQVGENQQMEPTLSRGDRYERTYELRSAAGEDVHGEANFVTRFSPRSLLDAGCGTGRVGRELNRRGVDVVGVDVDAEMLNTALARCPSALWIEGDISTIQLGTHIRHRVDGRQCDQLRDSRVSSAGH
jgi:ubiquinone/menaquinone biosynthesis C-methylase UbiE